MSRLDIDQAELNALLTGPGGPVYRTVRGFAEAVVEEVRTNGPLSEPQYERPPGLLREDMGIKDEVVTPEGPRFTVGTDPVNPRDGDHYAHRVHQGRSAIDSAQPMVFRYGGQRHSKHHVGPAAPEPFLYDAIRVANRLDPDVQFLTVEEDT